MWVVWTPGPAGEGEAMNPDPRSFHPEGVKVMWCVGSLPGTQCGQGVGQGAMPGSPAPLGVH